MILFSASRRRDTSVRVFVLFFADSPVRGCNNDSVILAFDVHARENDDILLLL